MKYDEFIDVISNDVSRIISENTENILNHIISDVSSSDNPTETQLRLCKNTMAVSVQLSVQIIFDYLDSLGMLNYQNLEEHHERPALMILRGGLSDKETD